MDQVDDGEYGSAKEKSVAGQNAIRKLSQPVKGKLFVAQVLAFLSGVLAIAPYVALVELGRELMQDQVDPARVNWICLLYTSPSPRDS